MSSHAASEPSDRVTEVARSIRVLGALTWPEGIVQRFLEGWRRGDPALPVVTRAPVDLRAPMKALDALGAAADRADPLQAFAAKTAASYASAGRMLEAAGTPAFTAASRELYGGPQDPLPGERDHPPARGRAAPRHHRQPRGRRGHQRRGAQPQRGGRARSARRDVQGVLRR